ncbi:Na+/H+ antiporter NhaA [Pantoea sp. Aalb]|nr:Na+/H+ antiporter NhaA [Pantoea sp. Aalb]MXP67157.1 Na+/H+ antiporter NhaA [Pantoea sp. Aalb]
MIKLIQNFIKINANNGMMMMIAALAAIILANNEFTSEIYKSFLYKSVYINFSSVKINKPLLFWINDALMVLFFLLISLEVKRELIIGRLSHYEQAIFPLIGALGGIIVPGLIFFVFNHSKEIELNGWAIPTATDIAFTLGVVSILGSHVSKSLKIFLMTLAIIDDLVAIAIILFVYHSHIKFLPLIIAISVIILLLILNKRGVYNTSVYMLVGLILWIAILKSGVHATLAGVIIGLFIPIKEKNGYSPAKNLVCNLTGLVNWFILPLFAFANAGVSFHGISLRDMILPESLGIILGLLIGKPLGISLFCWLAVKVRLAIMPSGTSISDIIAIGILCGIGFTMSIFIASLAFDSEHQRLVTLSKLAIFTGSLFSAFIGYTILRIKSYVI